MRRLIVCCDGTWNTPEDESVTNVRRLHSALDDTDDDGNHQMGYYQAGVGTGGSLLARLLGGGAGLGLSRNIMDAYHWLASRYQPGDRIALVGFSRGAYTARSLAGMISACGLVDTSNLGRATVWRQIGQVYLRGYRQRREGDERWRAGLTFRYDPRRREQIPVDFVGVWDTVGALGIPDYLGWLNLLDPLRYHDFHDLTLNPYIAHARHAVAMDERRSPYAPTLWSEPVAPGQDVKQVWFPGSHKDVGGGHRERGLSDGALLWMIEEARAATRLGFVGAVVDQIRPDPLDVLHDDDRGTLGLLEPLVDPLLKPWLEVVLQPRPRAVPRIDPSIRDPAIHASVYQRHRVPPITSGHYRPTRVLAPGESESAEVFARQPWNETGLYLEAGDYAFSADGQWRDGVTAAGPAGIGGPIGLGSVVHTGRLVGAVTGQLERVLRLVSGNTVANLIGTRREENAPWMSLVGVVANDAIPLKGALNAHERIAIGAGTRHRVTRDGYCYAFANDAWGPWYANNQGSVRLTVTRISTPVREIIRVQETLRSPGAAPRRRPARARRVGRTASDLSS